MLDNTDMILWWAGAVAAVVEWVNWWNDVIIVSWVRLSLGTSDNMAADAAAAAAEPQLASTRKSVSRSISYEALSQKFHTGMTNHNGATTHHNGATTDHNWRSTVIRHQKLFILFFFSTVSKRKSHT